MATESDLRRSATATLRSAGAWLTLFGGVASLGAAAALPRAVAMAEAKHRLATAEHAADAAETELQQLRSLAAALRSDTAFRREWLRREWRRPLPAGVEVLPVGDGLSLNRTAPAQVPVPEPPAWADAARTLCGGAWPTALAAGGWLGLAYGLLAGPSSATVAGSIRWAVAGRYRVDRPHALAGPHEPAGRGVTADARPDR